METTVKRGQTAVALALAAALAFFGAGAGSAWAQEGGTESSEAPAQITPAAGATLVPVDPTEFYRVETGVFQILQGQSVDLTDHRILFTMRRNPQGAIVCVINNVEIVCRSGTRLDFKNHARFQPGHNIKRKLLSEREECFLDATAIISPEGEPASGVFRLHCE